VQITATGDISDKRLRQLHIFLVEEKDLPLFTSDNLENGVEFEFTRDLEEEEIEKLDRVLEKYGLKR